MATKTCPDCAETIQAEAKVCRYCGKRFDGEEMRATERDAKAERGRETAKGCGYLLGIILLIAAIGKIFGGDDATGNSTSPTAAASASAEDQQKRTKGFHCLSSWDGDNADAKEELKKTLRDPDSLEVIESSITPVEKGKHMLFMKYRARNGFGGMNVGQAVFSIDHETCAATMIGSADR